MDRIDANCGWEDLYAASNKPPGQLMFLNLKLLVLARAHTRARARDDSSRGSAPDLGSLRGWYG